MRSLRLFVVLSGVLFSASAVMAQSSADNGPKLPENQILPELRQHDKPRPFAIQPFFDLGWVPGEMPYRMDKLHPSAGPLEALMGSASPIKLGAGFSGAGNAKEAFARTTLRSPKVSLMATGVLEAANDYEDGKDETVRFGYERRTEQVGMALRPRPGTTVKAAVVHDLIDDHVLPLVAPTTQNGVNIVSGFGADPIKTERTVAMLSLEEAQPVTALDRLKVQLRYVGIDRTSNNFSLRSYNPNARIESRPSRDVFSASVAGDFDVAEDVVGRLTLSGDRILHDATRRGGPNTSLNTISGHQYPGVEVWEAAANLDLAWKPAPASQVNLGVRYDYVSAEATKLDSVMQVGAGGAAFSGTVRSLYETYFGTGVADAVDDDHLISAKLEGEQKFLGDRLSLTGSVGRIMRAPDTQERYFALPSMNNSAASGTSARQVGNPGLDPEQHYRAEAGVAMTGGDWLDYGRKRPGGDDWLTSDSWRVGVSGYADHVVDFISRDRAHGQDGVLVSDNAFIWRNVDANLVGVEAEAAVNLTRNLSTRLLVDWRWGQNASEDRALYGIDPLEANWLVEYQDSLGDAGTWNTGFKFRAVARQGLLDDDPSAGSGFDAENSGGFGLFDLFAGLQVYDTVGVRLGVNNLFDKAYSEFNPANATDVSNPSAVAGPGRTVYIRGLVTF